VQSSSTEAALSPSLGLDRSGFKKDFAALGRKASNEAAQRVLDKITSGSSWSQTMAPDIDTDRQGIGMPTSKSFVMPRSIKILPRELYAVESDPNYNPFAQGVGQALQTIKNSGVRITVLSDIHVDIRSAFERARLLSLIDLFVLSFEHGVQEPRPEVFRLALEGLNLPATQVLMVGDRAAYDGRPSGKAWSHCCCRRCAR
jgi:phosphoglycolate phosphatase-like HAD superfamily hydrolase